MLVSAHKNKIAMMMLWFPVGKSTLTDSLVAAAGIIAVEAVSEIAACFAVKRLN